MTCRQSCGTLDGILAHQAADEPPCGFCAHAEAVARLAAEGVPERPPDLFAPVTEAQAHANAVLLLAEEEEFERQHGASNVRLSPDELAERRARRAGAA